MSQKLRPAMRAAATAPVPHAEPAESTTKGIPASAETAIGVTAIPAEALEAAGNAITTAAGHVAAASVEAPTTAVAIETTPYTKIQSTEKKLMNNMDEIIALSQGNLKAFMKSGQIWRDGVQLLTKEIAAMAKVSFDDSVSNFKALSTAKSLTDVAELQTRFAKAAIEQALAGTQRVADSSIKLTEETLAPVIERAGLAGEAFKTLTERTLAPPTDLVNIAVRAVGKAA